MDSVETIRFCDVCENKLYHQVDQDSLVHFCRVCGIKDSNQANTGMCVLNIEYSENGSQQKRPIGHIYNKYTKYDPTLPHLQLPCPNEQCKTNEKNDGSTNTSDIIYLRYDNARMKHLYVCTVCEYSWKSE